MQDIEIRRTLEAEEIAEFHANPAVIAGVNGEPDKVVVGVEIIVPGEGVRAFSMSIEMCDQAYATLGRASVLACALEEDTE